MPINTRVELDLDAPSLASMRFGPTSAVIALSAVVALVIGAGVLTSAHSKSEGKSTLTVAASPHSTEQLAPGAFAAAAEGSHGYPDNWKTTIANAASTATFTLLVPSSQLADATNLSAVYVNPAGTLAAMDYPIPASDAASSQGLLTSNIEISELPWTVGEPTTFLKDRIANFPVSGPAMCNVGAQPAMCVPSRLAGSLGQSNDADVLLDLDNDWIELQGGDSVQNLIDIASTLSPATAH
jgi:hypothetical protein